MADEIRVQIELGPKGKKAVAVASQWPGLSRGAKSEEAAVERLLAYVPRYAPVAALAGMGAAFPAAPEATVIERYPGTGSTDFWGLSFAFSSVDKAPMSADELERELALMRAAWAFFDEVRARVSAEMQRGPRGGGRDRDQIVRHTFAAELGWSPKIGERASMEAMLTDEGLAAHRDDYCAAIRALHAEGAWAGKRAKWPLRFLIRHTAFHTLDHAWEMEDKDLTGK